jgi:hypothetical protein
MILVSLVTLKWVSQRPREKTHPASQALEPTRSPHHIRQGSCYAIRVRSTVVCHRQLGDGTCLPQTLLRKNSSSRQTGLQWGIYSAAEYPSTTLLVHLQRWLAYSAAECPPTVPLSAQTPKQHLPYSAAELIALLHVDHVPRRHLGCELGAVRFRGRDAGEIGPDA